MDSGNQMNTNSQMNASSSNNQMNTSSSSNKVDTAMSSLYGYANNIGNKGSKKILKSLVKSSDAYQTINDIQNELSLSYNRINPALLFLESLGCNRSSTYQILFNNIKTKLMAQLSNLNDDGLLKVLKQTFPFLIFNELKSIPLFIIKSLKRIPNAYLLKLSEGPYLKDLPLSIRRQAWQLNNPNFIESIKNQCENIVVLSDTIRLNEGHIKQLCEYIGTSENLFTTFANYCCKRSLEDDQPLWGSLLRQVLMGTQEGNNRIQSLGMLYEIAWIIDNCRRQNKLETKRFYDIIEKVKALVIVQAFQLSKRLNRPMVTEKRLGNINHVLKVNENNPKTALIRDANCISKPIKAVQSRDHFSITTSDSNLIKSLKGAINYLVRMDEDKVFENRVDDSIAPGYSSFIKNPMEIATIKKKLSEYKNLDDLNTDVGLMFENCIKYNGLESYYGMLADKYWKKWNAKLNKEKLSTSDSGNLTLQQALEEALKYLTSLDSKRYFAFKVTDEIAPDYSKEIRNPMDFGSMKKKLGSYTNFDSFDNDAHLIYNNCIHYNGIDSMLGAIASEHKNKWEVMKERLIKRIVIEGITTTLQPSIPLPLPPPPSIPATNERKLNLKPKKHDFGDEADLESSMKSVEKSNTTSGLFDDKAKAVSLSKGLDEAVNFLTGIDTNNVFATRVTDEIAPGYSQIIKNPVDLGKIKKKLNGYTNLDEFDADVVLMFDNCVKYNGRGSIFANLALDFKNKWSKFKSALKERISYDIKDQVVISSQGSTGDAPKIKLVLTLKKDVPPPAPKEVKAQIIPTVPNTKKNLPEVKTNFTFTSNSTMKEAIRAAIEFSWFYLIDLDKNGYFACPVTDLVAPGYSKTIENPIDLSIIRVKIDRKFYKSIESFDNDVQLMLRNCFTYNNDGSQIYKDTEIFKDTWDAELIAIKKVLGPHAISVNEAVKQSAPSLGPAKKRMRYGAIMEPVKMIVSESSAQLELSQPSEKIELHQTSNSSDINPIPEKLINNNVSEQVAMDIDIEPAPFSNNILKSEKIKAVEAKAPKRSSTVKRVEQVKSAINIATNRKQHADIPSGNSNANNLDDFLYNNSINAAKLIQDKSREFEKFPEILTETKLMWAICMLRDSSVQNIFLEFLGLHIASLEGKIIILPGGKKSFKDFKLPYNDGLCKLLLQLCQLSFFRDLNIHALDEKLIRVYLPLLILNVNQSKDDANDNDEEIKVIEKSKQIVNKILSDEMEFDNSSNSHNNDKKKLMIAIAKILLSV